MTCYLCRGFGHRARDYKEMARGPWPAEDSHRWELHQKKWGEIKDLLISGQGREQVAAAMGVTMTDAKGLDDEKLLSLLLARVSGLPEWDIGERPQYVCPNRTPLPGTTSMGSTAPDQQKMVPGGTTNAF